MKQYEVFREGLRGRRECVGSSSQEAPWPSAPCPGDSSSGSIPQDRSLHLPPAQSRGTLLFLAHSKRESRNTSIWDFKVIRFFDVTSIFSRSSALNHMGLNLCLTVGCLGQEKVRCLPQRRRVSRVLRHDPSKKETLGHQPPTFTYQQYPGSASGF